MKKNSLIYLIVFVAAVQYVTAQEQANVSKNRTNVELLDVEDKAIDCVVDYEKVNYYLNNIIKTYLDKDQEKETQEGKSDEESKKPSKIQALKIAYISSKLNLKVDESEKFWPVYNEYVDELKKLKDITSELEKDEKVLAIRKKYKENFDKIIGDEKTNTLYKAEKEFKKMMQETLIMQKLNKDGGTKSPQP